MLLLNRAYTDEGKIVDNRLITDRKVDEQDKIYAWLRKVVHQRKNTNFKFSSVDIANLANKELNTDFTHNEVKDALLQLNIFPVDPDEFAWHYKASFRWEKKK